MRRLLLGAVALLATMIVLIPEDASAYWRGGWRGPGWGGYRVAGWGGYRPIYGPWAVGPVVRVVPAPIIVTYPTVYGYAAPYPPYGGYYGHGGYYGNGGYYGSGGYYGYAGCVTDDGYRRIRSCDR